MITLADPAAGRAHDAYHRLLRDGVWNMSGLWRILATHAVSTFAPTGVISLDCDDTLFHKSGSQVNGAGVFRDAVRSTSKRVVYALGLNLVVITLRVTPPWGSMPIAIPVNARLHKKSDPITTVELRCRPPKIWTHIDRDYETLRSDMRTLLHDLGVSTAPPASA